MTQQRGARGHRRSRRVEWRLRRGLRGLSGGRRARVEFGGGVVLLGDARADLHFAKSVNGMNISKAEFDLTQLKTPWFRITINDAGGRMAWSNPYWLEDIF